MLSGNDTDKLLRENEKLKKSLEKEQFFNKLLDQEIQELKMNSPAYAANRNSIVNTGRAIVVYQEVLFICC